MSRSISVHPVGPSPPRSTALPPMPMLRTPMCAVSGFLRSSFRKYIGPAILLIGDGATSVCNGIAQDGYRCSRPRCQHIYPVDIVPAIGWHSTLKSQYLREYCPAEYKMWCGSRDARSQFRKFLHSKW
jgi:hypothetical protein